MNTLRFRGLKVLGFFSTLTSKLLSWFEQFISRPVHPFFPALYRVLYALAALPVAYCTFTLSDFVWYGSSADQLFWINASHSAWLAALIALLLGIYPRIAAFYCMLAAPILFDTSIGSNLLQIGAFWLLFMDSNQTLCFSAFKAKAPYRTLAWPFYLLALNLLVLECFSGISKFFDPFWRNGLGFYYTLIQPWLKPDFVSPVLDVQAFMVFFNYLAMSLQVMGLPLFFFQRTRFHSLFIIFGSYAFFTFPLRIDPIGPVGLALTLPLFGILFPVFDSEYRKLPSIISQKLANSGLYSASLNKLPIRWLNLQKILASVLVVFLSYFSFYTLLIALPERLDYPVAAYPFRKVGVVSPPLPKPLKLLQRDLTSLNRKTLIRDINRYTMSIGFWSPFTFKHFLGRYLYRVTAHLKNGKTVEPFVVFNPEGSGGYEKSYLGQPSILLNRMWLVGLLCHKISLDKYYRLSKEEDRLLRSLFYLTKNRLATREQSQISYLSLLVKPILVPNQYQGNVSPWNNIPYRELFRFDPQKAQYHVKEQSIPVNFQAVLQKYDQTLVFDPFNQ